MNVEDKYKKVGLVLGGGGARSFAHLGVIDVLRENGVPIDILVTCSGGSIIGALVANNIPTDQIKNEFYNRLSRARWLLPKPSRKGLLSQRGIKKIILSLCGNIDINQCHIPLYIVATNLNKGKLHVFSKGDLSIAVSASVAFPGIYTPIEIDNQLFVDGGILNSIPADICRNLLGEEGVVISLVLDGFLGQKVDKNNMFSIIYRSIYIPLFQNRKHIVKKNSDVILNIFGDFEFNFKNWRDVLSFYSKRKMEYFYQLGKEKAYENLDKITEAIKMK